MRPLKALKAPVRLAVGAETSVDGAVATVATRRWLSTRRHLHESNR